MVNCEISAQLAAQLAKLWDGLLPNMGYEKVGSRVYKGSTLELHNSSGIYHLWLDRAPKGYSIYRVNGGYGEYKILAKTELQARKYFCRRWGYPLYARPYAGDKFEYYGLDQVTATLY